MKKSRVLIIGGSGHVSGAMTRKCQEHGFDITIITRGQRPVPAGVKAWIADRNDETAMRKLLTVDHADAEFDAVIDCICYEPAAMRLDLELLGLRTRQLLFISTDFVFDSTQRRFPQPEDAPYLADDVNGTQSYGFKKRQCELLLLNQAPASLDFAVFRPCHIYGMPSELGCFPAHCRDKELIRKMQAGTTLELVDGGHFLQQPIEVNDLAATVTGAVGAPGARRQFFNMAGPDIVESLEYYRIIARTLGVEVKFASIPLDEYLATNPVAKPFFCHRIYTHDKLRQAGLPLPATALADGLARHTQAKLALM